jgi:hypothetical protein
MRYKTGCLICGKNLVFSKSATAANCFYCGAMHETHAACVEHHYVCDACHSASANDLIEKYCINTTSIDPIAMATQLMKNPTVKMHGPEHHFLVPAVLLASFSTLQSLPKKKRAAMIREARKRAEDVKGAFCGFQGACGAAIGTGIFISIITKATPYSTNEWHLSNLITAQSLSKIAEHGGPRCCKRDSFLAILSAVKFIRKELAVTIPIGKQPVCTFSPLNKECRGKNCPFFDKDSSDGTSFASNSMAAYEPGKSHSSRRRKI